MVQALGAVGTGSGNIWSQLAFTSSFVTSGLGFRDQGFGIKAGV